MNKHINRIIKVSNESKYANKFLLNVSVTEIIIFKSKNDNTAMPKLSYDWGKITHMWRRWGSPQNFLWPFIDELWETWKIEKIAGIIILHRCTKSHNHMKYSSWDTKSDKFFLSFWAIFCPFTPHPPNNPENQNFEKMTKHIWRCHHSKLVQQKTRSYNVCLVKYGVWKT